MTAECPLQLLSAVESSFLSGDKREVIVIPMLIEARVRNNKVTNFWLYFNLHSFNTA
jgi:hypothetical protein